VERAKREPEGRCNSLAHLIDVPALERAYHRQRSDAAVGVDGVTKEQYGQNLEANLQDLHARLKDKRYRHQPIRRVHIPKGQGQTRPIGMSAFEDKLVQDAVREVLEAIYQGLCELLAWLSARAQCPRRRAHPQADRRSGRSEMDLRGRHDVLLGSYILMPPSSTHGTHESDPQEPIFPAYPP
jgi:hypothetical protein